MNSIAYAYKRFCRARFPLPSESQVADLERRIDVIFPEDYRRFLLEFNGGYFDDPNIEPPDAEFPRESLAFLCGIGAAHPEAELGDPVLISLFDDNHPPQIVPIGATPMGSLLVLVTRSDGRGEILLKEAYGGFYYLADGMEEFFDLLHSPDSSGPV